MSSLFNLLWKFDDVENHDLHLRGHRALDSNPLHIRGTPTEHWILQKSFSFSRSSSRISNSLYDPDGEMELSFLWLLPQPLMSHALIMLSLLVMCLVKTVLHYCMFLINLLQLYRRKIDFSMIRISALQKNGNQSE